MSDYKYRCFQCGKQYHEPRQSDTLCNECLTKNAQHKELIEAIQGAPTQEALKEVKILREGAESILNENIDLRKALRFYADKEEWYGKPWKLSFNSSSRDGDGWEVAEEALKEPK